MQITTDIKTKVLGQYIGQKIVLHESRFSEEEKDRTFILSGVGINAFQVKETRQWYNFETMAEGSLIDTLILKPLSKITDEDAQMVAHLQGYTVKEKKTVRFYFYSSGLKCSVNWGEWKSHTSRETVSLFSIQYLQQQGYDVPNLLLNNKTLEKAGLAIYEGVEEMKMGDVEQTSKD